MNLADRIRQFRIAKNLSQGDIENRTGLLRCYISRVENGHTVPAVETLEKIARALEIPLYQLFYPEDKPASSETQLAETTKDWATHGKGHRVFTKFRFAASRMSPHDRTVLLETASTFAKLSRRKSTKGAPSGLIKD